MTSLRVLTQQLMKNTTDEKDIGHPLLVTIITVPYSKETLKHLFKHFMALNQRDNMGIQK